MDEIENNVAGTGGSFSEIDQLHLANRDLQDQLAATRRELEAARASERLVRESRWWRLGLALKNRRNVLFALRHPIWAFKTLAGLRTRRGRLGRGARQSSAVTARQWLVGISAEPRVPEDLWIAGIFDEELAQDLEPDCNLITFRPDNWEANLEGRRPHMLLVESAEHGNGGSWEYRIASTPHADAAGLQDLRALIDWCRANGTPTVFWHTAPLGSVERFSEAAALFDHVVATDPNAAMRLQRSGELRAPSVFVVPPGVQPAVSSPIGAALASDVGTIAPSGVPDETFEQLLGAAQTFGLTIYAAAGEDVARSEGVTFVRPDTLERAPANHAVYINGESAGLPARALRAVASGAVVVSVPNRALEEALGDAVTIARSTEEGKEAIQRLLSDDVRRARTAGLHAVLGKHTIRHRLGAIARTAGLGIDEGLDARVAALVLASAAGDAYAIARRLSATGAFAEIVIGSLDPVLPQNVTEDQDKGPPLRVVQQDPALGKSARVQALAAAASTPWVALVQADGDVDTTQDLLLAQRFARADVLSMGEAYVFTESIDPEHAVARREIVAARGWPPTPQWAREGVRLFTIPR